ALSTVWPPTWRRSPSASPRSRSRSYGPTGRRRNKTSAAAGTDPSTCGSAAGFLEVASSGRVAVACAAVLLRADKSAAEKRAACGCKRPKSREETPKEGGGNARRYRTATTYTATHK